MTIQASWDRIEAWLKHSAPEELTELGLGATDQDIQEAETALGMTFPEEVRTMYRLHNGYVPIADAQHSFWELLSLEEVVYRWNMSRGTYDLLAPVQPQDQVQPQIWNLDWIPLLIDAGRAGVLLCLDLAPGPAGHSGQIFQIDWEDSSDRPVLAASFGELLSTFADDLEAGIYTWYEGLGFDLA